MDDPMTMEKRCHYIKLTEVLLEAYHEMLNMNIRHVLDARVPPPLRSVLVWELEALIERSNTTMSTLATSGERGLSTSLPLCGKRLCLSPKGGSQEAINTSP